LEAKVKRDPLIVAATFLGAGMGGFIDGIVFHQILQLQGMVSARTPKTSMENVQVNLFWDGVFHLFTWSRVAIGLKWLCDASKQLGVLSGRTLIAGMLIGWGVFNVVDGLVNHVLLDLHHVVEQLGRSVWDWVFLIFGLSLTATGAWLLRRSPDSPIGHPLRPAGR
jgi:uncharacterized membrane protein